MEEIKQLKISIPPPPPSPENNLERLLTIPTIKNICGPGGPTGAYCPFVSFNNVRLTGSTGSAEPPKELCISEVELEKKISWRDYLMFK